SPLSPLPLTGATLTVRTAKTVTLVADGSSTPLTTTATTVGQALADADVGYQHGDQLSASLTAPVVAGATYRLVRIQVSDQVQQTTMAATVTWVKRSSLPAGSSELISSGSDGVRQRTLRVRYQDGIAVASTLVSDKVITAPTGWVIAVGTGASGSGGIGIGVGVGTAGVTYESTFVPATGKVVGRAPNFAALAMCETHARPRAVNPSGKYRGMYQFDLKTWHGVGGVGDPIDATPAEQTYRAQLLYDNRGRAPWPYCGRFL
ncbi:MAG: transglycosylase family protein, partial [Candidatus Nanopelagicales bacterium]